MDAKCTCQVFMGVCVLTAGRMQVFSESPVHSVRETLIKAFP